MRQTDCDAPFHISGVVPDVDETGSSVLIGIVVLAFKMNYVQVVIHQSPCLGMLLAVVLHKLVCAGRYAGLALQPALAGRAINPGPFNRAQRQAANLEQSQRAVRMWLLTTKDEFHRSIPARRASISSSISCLVSMPACSWRDS